MSLAISAKLFPPGNERRYLTIEFFRNNLAWGEDLELGNKHFAFGREKAKIIIECWGLIEEYVNTNGSTPATGEVLNYHMSGTTWGGDVTVIKEPEFKRGPHLIEKHFLKFTYGKLEWGFGLTKAKALIGYKEMIQIVADRG